MWWPRTAEVLHHQQPQPQHQKMAPYVASSASAPALRLVDTSSTLLVAPKQLGATNTNGPVRLGSDMLLFSDTENKAVSFFALNLTSRKLRTTSVAGHSFGGMALDEHGTGLYVADHTTHTISHLIGESVNSFAGSRGLTLKPLTEALPPPLPNGVIARSDGVLYFTAGKLYSRRCDGSVRVEAAYEGSYANGLALAPDERTLFVAVSFPAPAGIDAYRVASSGSLTLAPELSFRDGRTFSPLADELAVSPHGGGRVFAATGGESLGWYEPESRSFGSLHVAHGIRTVSVAADAASPRLFVTTSPGGVFEVRLDSTLRLLPHRPAATVTATVTASSAPQLAGVALGSLALLAVVALFLRTAARGAPTGMTTGQQQGPGENRPRSRAGRRGAGSAGAVLIL